MVDSYVLSLGSNVHFSYVLALVLLLSVDGKSTLERLSDEGALVVWMMKNYACNFDINTFVFLDDVHSFLYDLRDI